MIKTTPNTSMKSTTQQLPNYRIYDRTGGGVRHDIYAESLDAAIEEGREWIEDGDWGKEAGENEECRLLKLDCCVREIVRIPDLSSIISLPGVVDASVVPGDTRGEENVRIMVECGPETRLAMIPGQLVDGSTLDGDGYYDAVFLIPNLPTTTDCESTDNGQCWDCSGEFRQALSEPND